MQDLLFSPITIGGLEVKNRILMPAMHLNMADNYAVTGRLVEFYAERARGGAGMITVGYATVDDLAGNPGNIGAHSDEFIPGLARLATAIRDNGARASVQINHAGRYNHSMLTGGKQPVAPSPVASRMTRETPRELSIEEIDEVIAGFAAAARRVQQAGFDAVEVLAGTGYLLSEFLSPITNRRVDRYGGSFENRIRFAREVIVAVRQAVGESFPIIVRVNGNDFMNGGVSRHEQQEYTVRLVKEGANAVCINVGWHEAQVPQIVTEVPRGVFAYLARGIRERVDVPVIASHRINDPTVARELLQDGMCDMVAMGRALIADPFLPEKASQGREDEIIHCVACGQGCFDNLFRMQAVECLCNPRAGYEKQTKIRKSSSPMKVMVVGGGAGGMSAAIAAAGAGHAVTLYEKSGELGGQLHLAGAPPGRDEFRRLAHDLQRQVRLHKIEVETFCSVDERLLDSERPDRLILATGGSSITPSVRGADLPHVFQAWDVLSGKAVTGKRVVVIGGGAVGVETALFLAEKGTISGEALKFLLIHGAETAEELQRLATCGTKEVMILEMLDDLGNNFGRTTRWGMMQDLERYGVKSRTAVKAVEITPTSVIIEKDGLQAAVLADNVVLAVGTRPFNPLQAVAANLGIQCSVVGDAGQAAMVFDAIHQGFNAGAALG